MVNVDGEGGGGDSNDSALGQFFILVITSFRIIFNVRIRCLLRRDESLNDILIRIIFYFIDSDNIP